MTNIYPSFNRLDHGTPSQQGFAQSYHPGQQAHAIYLNAACLSCTASFTAPSLELVEAGSTSVILRSGLSSNKPVCHFGTLKGHVVASVIEGTLIVGYWNRKVHIKYGAIFYRCYVTKLPGRFLREREI